MYVWKVCKEVTRRVAVYLVSGSVFFPAWFFWNVKEVEFLYVGSYLMHFVGGLGFGLGFASAIIAAGKVERVSRRFYWITFPVAFVLLTALEWVQMYQPWRSFQWEDILAQTIGLALALGIVWWNETRIISTASFSPVAAE